MFALTRYKTVGKLVSIMICKSWYKTCMKFTYCFFSSLRILRWNRLQVRYSLTWLIFKSYDLLKTLCTTNCSNKSIFSGFYCKALEHQFVSNIINSWRKIGSAKQSSKAVLLACSLHCLLGVGWRLIIWCNLEIESIFN